MASSTDRGYGAEHRRRRAAIVQDLRVGNPVQCWRCGEQIFDEGDMHLGHDDHDRSIWRGAEHALCNLRAAAEKTNSAARRPLNSVEW